MLGIQKHTCFRAHRKNTAYVSGSSCTVKTRFQQGKSLAVESQFLGSGCQLLPQSEELRICVWRTLSSSHRMFSFSSLFCNCAGSQIAFVIPQTAQSTWQNASGSELHFQCLSGNKVRTDNPESSCEFLFSISSFIAFVNKFLNENCWFFILHLLPFSAIFLLLLNRETLAGLLQQKIRSPPKSSILNEEGFWRPGRRLGQLSFYGSLKAAPDEEAEEKQMSPRNPKSGGEFTGSLHFSTVGLSR